MGHHRDAVAAQPGKGVMGFDVRNTPKLITGISDGCRARVTVAAAGMVGLVVVFWRGAAWVELKAVTTTAPLRVALAFAGAAALARRPRLRSIALVAGALVAVAVLAGHALVCRETSLAPY